METDRQGIGIRDQSSHDNIVFFVGSAHPKSLKPERLSCSIVPNRSATAYHPKGRISVCTSEPGISRHGPNNNR